MNAKSNTRRTGTCWLAFGAALVALESMAATHTVSTEAELVAAVAAAAGKDTILLKSGTYDLSLVEPQNPKDSNGIASIFVESKTLHFAGVDRILDGTVDIGCYECNLPPVGTLMLFR